MTNSSLDRAVDLMREAQMLLDSDYPVLAAHVETVIGLAMDCTEEESEGRRSAG